MNIFKLNLEAFNALFPMSVLLIIIGIIFSLPMEYSTYKVLEILSPLLETWWRLAIFLVLFIGASLYLHGNMPILSEWLGSIGFFALFYPLLGLLAGLPTNIGWPGLFITLGTMMTISLVSGWSSLKLIQHINTLGVKDKERQEHG